MPYLASPVGYVAIVVAVLGLASAATFNLYAMTAKPSRAWDPEIDRIVAQYNEKRSHGLVARAEAATPPALAQSTAMASADPGAPLTEKQVQTATQSSKRPTRRTGKRDQFVPAAFVSLPKFAITAPKAAASTIRRIW